jgi:DNA invertase Pin-like site-specific DNA recombinase/ssDNA-binding Zn-finger/Zn-ribbon topoisomerase 1
MLQTAAGYFRVSTDNDSQKDSIPNQKKLFRNFIMKHDFQEGTFYAEKVSGTKTKREALDALISDAEHGLFNVIVVKELSRLARNTEYAHKIKRIMTNLDVRIISIDGQVDTKDPSKNNNFGLYAWLYEQEAQRISERTKSVFKMKMKEGKFMGSTPPYGYIIKEKKLYVRSEETKKTVQLIFEKYLDGDGEYAIAKYLTDNDVPTSAKLNNRKNTSGNWHGSSVKLILQNPHYTGKLVQHRQESLSVTNSKRKKINKEEHIIVENTHEAIINEATFDMVQKKIHEKSRQTTGEITTKEKHLLTGILKCADCGTNLWYKNNRKGYLCGKYVKHGVNVCSKHLAIEEDILEIIKKELTRFANINYSKSIKEEIEKSKIDNEKRLSRLISRIEKLKLKNKRYLDMVIDELITKGEYNAYRDFNNEKINELQEEVDELKYDIADVKFEFDDLKEKIESIIQLDDLNRGLLNSVIEKIVVHENGKLDFSYNFNPPTI